MKLPNAEQMRRIDQCAINEFGIPGVVLMENAGLGTVLLMDRLYGPLNKKTVPILVGPGNNGGDGLVIARHLYQRGCTPILIYLIDPEQLQGDSAINFGIVKKLNLEAHICNTKKQINNVIQLLQHSELHFGPIRVIVDALFGTGLQRNLKDRFKLCVDLINHFSKARNIPIIAVDTPSGLDSNNGNILGTCIQADATATYGCAKIGQLMPDSSGFTGHLEVIDIGIPPEAVERGAIHVSGIDHNMCRELLSNLRRTPNSHKGTYGHLLLVAGSSGKSGAAILAGRGAILSGCGLVTLCAPAELNTIFETSLIEAMTLPLPHSKSVFSVDDSETIINQLDDKNCLVLGPGLGQDKVTADLIMDLYESVQIPIIIDADAINILAAHKDNLPVPSGPRILTPHPGEMARLLAISPSEVQADRLKASRLCYQQYRSSKAKLIVILKGAATLVADDEHQYVCPTGNSAMAAGGMGDVLSGLIGSLICQGLSPLSASCLGVYLHGFSGNRLLNKKGVGFSAADLADELPHARKTLEEQS